MGNFSTTDFATLLDEVIASADAREDVARPVLKLDLLGAGLNSTPINAADAADYLFDSVDPTRSVKPPPLETPMPSKRTLSADPADIARELGLTGKEKAADLDRVRRAFAFVNHPDRVSESDREVAMTRMQIANRMIDEAKSRAETSIFARWR